MKRGVGTAGQRKLTADWAKVPHDPLSSFTQTRADPLC